LLTISYENGSKDDEFFSLNVSLFDLNFIKSIYTTRKVQRKESIIFASIFI
jgi:hypothetical protein